MIGTSIAAVILAATSDLNVTLVANVVSGATWTTAAIGIFGYFTENTPPEKVTSYSTVYNQIVSLAIFAGPILGSQLANMSISLTAVLWIGAVLRALAAVLILFNPFGRTPRVPQPAA